MNVELSKFRVIKGMEDKALEWIKFLQDNKDSVLKTLDGENMYVETIFSERDDEYMYLYWYSIQGENGIAVENSNHDVDKIHVEYWGKCIDESVVPINLTHQLTLLPKRVEDAF